MTTAPPQASAVTPRVALVHDFLIQQGGAEQVLAVLHQLYPSAPIYALVYDERRVGQTFRPEMVRPSFLQRLPGGVRRYQWFLPLMPLAIERLNLRDYDLVISSSSAFAKGALTSDAAVHVCYCHTPTRYLWSDAMSYVSELPYPKVVRSLIPPLLTRLRVWDRLAADRPDVMVANSRTVQGRIRKYYRREASVVYPPVDLSSFAPTGSAGGYYLTGGRLVAYKRFDLVIEAFNRLRLPLKIFGVGPVGDRLRQLAKPNIEFLGYQPLGRLAALYAGAIAFINPQEEDFGITVVEAMASGRPVIAYAAGGALETVREGETGTFFNEQNWESLADTVIRFRSGEYSPTGIRERAERFGVEAFRQAFQAVVASALRQQQSNHADRR